MEVNRVSDKSKILLNNCQHRHLSSPKTAAGRRTRAGDAVAFDGLYNHQ